MGLEKGGVGEGEGRGKPPLLLPPKMDEVPLTSLSWSLRVSLSFSLCQGPLIDSRIQAWVFALCKRVLLRGWMVVVEIQSSSIQYNSIQYTIEFNERKALSLSFRFLLLLLSFSSSVCDFEWLLTFNFATSEKNMGREESDRLIDFLSPPSSSQVHPRHTNKHNKIHEPFWIGWSIFFLCLDFFSMSVV